MFVRRFCIFLRDLFPAETLFPPMGVRWLTLKKCERWYENTPLEQKETAIKLKLLTRPTEAVVVTVMDYVVWAIFTTVKFFILWKSEWQSCEWLLLMVYKYYADWELQEQFKAEGTKSYFISTASYLIYCTYKWMGFHIWCFHSFTKLDMKANCLVLVDIGNTDPLK